MVGITFWENGNVTWEIGMPTLGGVALNSTNCPSGAPGNTSSNSWLATGNSGTSPTTNFVGTTDNQSLVVKTNNVEAIRVLSTNQNVGIGVNNPAQKLDVNGVVKATGLLISTSAGAGKVLISDASGNATWQTLSAGSAWGLSGNASTTPGTNYIGTSDAQSVVFKSSNVEAMRILTSGNIGIGTTTPSTKLDVNGTIKATALLLSTSAGAGKVLTSDASGNATWQTLSSGSGWGLSGNASTTPGTNYIGTSDAQSVVFKSSNVEAMRILTSGNIGIGTATPSTKLDVNGTIKATALLLSTSAGAGKVLTSDASGNATWQTLSVGSGWGLSGNASTTPGTNYIGTSDAQSVVFKSSNVEAMRILTSGNIGIGTTTPSTKLDVNGTIKATALLLSTSAGAGKVLTSDASGNASWQTPSVTSAWTLTGNTGINPAITYIGTTDNQPVIFKTNGAETMRINGTGQVTVGAVTAPAGVKLAVGGNVIAEKVTVKLIANWADYVFDDNYRLPTLAEIENHISKYKRLPDMPSTEEVSKNGISIGDNQALLLQKIEELTLHLIELNKKVEKLSKENQQLKSATRKK